MYLEEVDKVLLGHGTRHLPHKHLDRVRVRLPRPALSGRGQFAGRAGRGHSAGQAGRGHGAGQAGRGQSANQAGQTRHKILAHFR